MLWNYCPMFETYLNRYYAGVGKAKWHQSCQFFSRIDKKKQERTNLYAIDSIADHKQILPAESYPVYLKKSGVCVRKSSSSFSSCIFFCAGLSVLTAVYRDERILLAINLLFNLVKWNKDGDTYRQWRDGPSDKRSEPPVHFESLLLGLAARASPRRNHILKSAESVQLSYWRRHLSRQRSIPA